VRKARVLAAARCLLVSSTVAETSSLVAMEAMASGTPVVTFPSGALVEIVEHGITGLIVHNVGEMAAAITACRSIDLDTCWQRGRERFSANRMTDQYVELYRRILGRADARRCAA
jgi:glycosyltransferase involved in cell wall biosynthesis